MTNPNDIIAKLLAEELAQHGAVRPPWVALPNTHPFDIAWRMGTGETHLELWARWAPKKTEVLDVIRRHGPIPADWTCWAAEALGEIEVDVEAEDLPFDEAREKLEALGVAVDGVPST